MRKEGRLLAREGVFAAVRGTGQGRGGRNISVEEYGGHEHFSERNTRGRNRGISVVSEGSHAFVGSVFSGRPLPLR